MTDNIKDLQNMTKDTVNSWNATLKDTKKKVNNVIKANDEVEFKDYDKKREELELENLEYTEPEIKQLIWEKNYEELVQSLKESKNFDEVVQKITSNTKNYLPEIEKIIQQDKIMDTSKSLVKANNEIKEIYDKYMKKQWYYQIPVIWQIISKVNDSAEDMKFRISWMRSQVEQVMEMFDESMKSLKNSKEMLSNFLDKLELDIKKTEAAFVYINKRKKEYEIELQNETDEEKILKLKWKLKILDQSLMELKTLIITLKLTYKRWQVRLYAISEMWIKMRVARPVFETILTTAIIEDASQQSLEASLDVMDSYRNVSNYMISDLTNRTIKSAEKTEKELSQTAVSIDVLEKSMTDLTKYLEEAEKRAEQVKKEQNEKMKKLSELNAKAEKMKNLTPDEIKEIEQEINLIKTDEK